jgi:hypothetical protein
MEQDLCIDLFPQEDVKVKYIFYIRGIVNFTIFPSLIRTKQSTVDR